MQRKFKDNKKQFNLIIDSNLLKEIKLLAIKGSISYSEMIEILLQKGLKEFKK